MAYTLQGCRGPTPMSFTAPSTTWYQSLLGCASAGSGSTFEVRRQVDVRFTGTISQLGCYVVSNARATTTVLRSRVNGVNGNQSASIAPGTTGFFEDAANSDVVNSADLVSASITTGAGSGPVIDIQTIWCQLNGGATTRSVLSTSYSSTRPTVSGGTTRYMPIGGELAAALYTTESAQIKHTQRAAGTYSGLQVHVGSPNTCDAESTVKLRINGGDGNQAVAIPAGTAGLFVDTLATDDVYSGELLNFAVVGGGTGSFAVAQVGMLFAGSGAQTDLVVGRSTSRTSSTTDMYVAVLGRLTLSTAAEAASQTVVPFETVLSRMRVNVSAHAGGDVTVQLRINGGDGNQSVLITGTGVFEDVSATDSISAGAKVNYKVSSGVSASTDFYLIALTVGAPTLPAGQQFQLIVAT